MHTARIPGEVPEGPAMPPLRWPEGANRPLARAAITGGPATGPPFTPPSPGWRCVLRRSRRGLLGLWASLPRAPGPAIRVVSPSAVGPPTGRPGFESPSAPLWSFVGRPPACALRRSPGCFAPGGRPPPALLGLGFGGRLRGGFASRGGRGCPPGSLVVAGARVPA